MARVLVIDDEPEVGHVLRRMLELEGHDVFVADDGARGFAAAPANILTRSCST